VLTITARISAISSDIYNAEQAHPPHVIEGEQADTKDNEVLCQRHVLFKAQQRKQLLG
jgi:hypothetical protein